MPDPKEGDLRTWHVPNPPRQPFHRSVKDVEEAKVVLNMLADYDNYLGDPLIFANAQGLETFRDGEWVEWYDDDDNDIMYALRDEWEARHVEG